MNQNYIENIKNTIQNDKNRIIMIQFFNTKLNRCYFDKYRFVLFLLHNIDYLQLKIRYIEMIPVLPVLKNIASIFPPQSRNNTDSQQF